MPASPAHADGDLLDLTGAFVTRRTIERDDTDIHHLTLETEDGTTWTALVPAASDCTVYGLQTGQRYEVTNVRFCVQPQTVTATDETCPECEGPLREGVAIDGQAPAVGRVARSLDHDEALLVASEATQFRRQDQALVDDWRPMDPGAAVPPVPDYVCDDCGRTFDERALHAPEAAVLKQANRCMAPQGDAASAETMGLATGGAKDVTNFRENIQRGYTPQPGAISTEGLFYDYYFETGGTSPDTDALFAPQYAAGVSEHPVTGDTEQYLAVGLDSTLSVADFRRPDLDLVAVLDVSGSMDSPFDEYYYDEQGRRREADTASDSKMEAATRALCALTEQLHDEDRLGVVLYNNRAHVAKPLRLVGETDMDAIRQHIREVSAGGGTNMEDGFAAAWDLLEDAPAGPERERRVVFMTDMMPNMGQTDQSQLRQQFEDAAAEGINTTFLGIGLDENADLADALSDVRGANHYFVHSVAEFERRLGEEFAYMVSPLVYDLQLELEGDDCEILAAHGAPGNADDSRLLHVTTLFPSPKDDGQTRGGIVLVELDARADAEIELVASWVERDGSAHSERMAVDLPAERPSYDHTGVRKAVALARYAASLRAWTEDVHARAEAASGVDDWIDPDAPTDQERESVPLTVSGEHAREFKTLRAYLVAEADAVGDDTLGQEVELLERLCAEAGIKIQPTADTGGEPN